MTDHKNFVEQYSLIYEEVEYKADIFICEDGGYRGEILGLNGGAEFYGKNEVSLLTEFRDSLQAYLEVCAEAGIAPLSEESVQEDDLFSESAEEMLGKWAIGLADRYYESVGD